MLPLHWYHGPFFFINVYVISLRIVFWLFLLQRSKISPDEMHSCNYSTWEAKSGNCELEALLGHISRTPKTWEEKEREEVDFDLISCCFVSTTWLGSENNTPSPRVWQLCLLFVFLPQRQAFWLRGALPRRDCDGTPSLAFQRGAERLFSQAPCPDFSSGPLTS